MQTGLDDPDQMFYENYSCGSDRNYTGYCDAEVDTLIDEQSVVGRISSLQMFSRRRGPLC